MKSFTQLLRGKTAESKSIVCLGMDPVLERIPIKEQSPEKRIVKFYEDIVAASVSSGAKPAAAKPNYAYFAQYGFPGLRALKKTIGICKRAGIITILDAKRGDIGKSSEAYAKEAFDFWKADAVTISPYMGKDSIEPFLAYSGKGKGVYMLVRTSNPGAVDFQELESGGRKLYMAAATKIVDWHVDGLGAVVGATSIVELNVIASFFNASGKPIPMLIPGVGSQGGSASEVARALKNRETMAIHRINSSSGINYAYEKSGTEDYAGAAVKAMKELNSEIGEL